MGLDMYLSKVKRSKKGNDLEEISKEICVMQMVTLSTISMQKCSFKQEDFGSYFAQSRT